MLAFAIGASIMIVGGLVELFLGVKAERKGLEEIATPLSAEQANVPSQRGADSSTPTTGATTG